MGAVRAHSRRHVSQFEYRHEETGPSGVGQGRILALRDSREYSHCMRESAPMSSVSTDSPVHVRFSLLIAAALAWAMAARATTVIVLRSADGTALSVAADSMRTVIGVPGAAPLSACKITRISPSLWVALAGNLYLDYFTLMGGCAMGAGPAVANSGSEYDYYTVYRNLVTGSQSNPKKKPAQ